MGLRADTDAPRRGFRKLELSLLVFVGAQKIPIERTVAGTMVPLSLRISYHMKKNNRHSIFFISTY